MLVKKKEMIDAVPTTGAPALDALLVLALETSVLDPEETPLLAQRQLSRPLWHQFRPLGHLDIGDFLVWHRSATIRWGEGMGFLAGAHCITPSYSVTSVHDGISVGHCCDHSQVLIPARLHRVLQVVVHMSLRHHVNIDIYSHNHQHSSRMSCLAGVEYCYDK